MAKLWTEEFSCGLEEIEREFVVMLRAEGDVVVQEVSVVVVRW